MSPKCLAFALLAGLTGAAPNNVFDVRAAKCNDDCARVIAGTAANLQPSLVLRRNDCSSFLLTTVIACPATTTVTVSQTDSAVPSIITLISGSLTTFTATTVTVVSTASPPVQRRLAVSSCTPSTVTASTLPSYASVKCGAASSRYASACGCLGVSQSTTTIPSTTVTVYSQVTTTIVPIQTTIQVSVSTVLATATSTVVTTVTNAAPCSSFVVQDSTGFFQGQYLFTIPYWNYEARFTPDRVDATRYTILSDGSLVVAGDPSNVMVGGSYNGDSFGQFQLYSNATTLTYFQRYPVKCSLPADSASSGSGQLSCSSSSFSGYNYFQECYGSPELQLGRKTGYCGTPILIASPAC